MSPTDLIALICLALMATFSIAQPPPFHIIPSGTHLSSGAHFPTGSFPTASFPHGTATNGNPIIPLPTIDASEDSEHEKRFEGPRHQPRPIAWRRYNPKGAKPSKSGGPRPSGTRGFPTAGPTASRPSTRPTAF